MTSFKMLKSLFCVMKEYKALLIVSLLSVYHGAFSCQAEDEAGRRVLALVIGNGDYQGMATLTNAKRDAELVSNTLKSIGVDSIITGYDLSREEMSGVLNSFFQSMIHFDIGFFYFAGHGMQDEFQDSYIIPVDYSLGSSADVFTNGFPMNRIIRGCSRMDEKAFILFLDACRNNPFSSDFRSSGGGLGRPDVPSEGVLVGYSTESGKVAGDYAELLNGLYASALCSALSVPNLKAEEILKEVGSQVRQKSFQNQNPEWWGNLSGDVVINYDSEQYEIQLSELQNQAIKKVHSFLTATDISLAWNVTGLAIPPDLLSLSSSFRAYGDEHHKRGQQRLAEQAALYALLLDYFSSEDQHRLWLSCKSAKTLSQCDIFTLFDQNEKLMQLLGLTSPRELRILISNMSLTLCPDSETLKQFFDDLWEEDDVTWFVGMGSFGYFLQEATNSTLRITPAHHHFAVSGDTIADFSNAAYPGSNNLNGLLVRSLRSQNGDTLHWQEAKVRNEGIILELEGIGDVVLPPRSGFVVNDSVFIDTPSREEIFQRFAAMLPDLAEVEVLERKYWAGELDTLIPEFLRVMPLQTIYSAKHNWRLELMNITWAFESPTGGVCHAMWEYFKYSYYHVCWQHENPLLCNNMLTLNGLSSLQSNSNKLLFLPDEYLIRNKKKITKLLGQVASTISGIHSDHGYYSGGYQLHDLPGPLGDIVASFGGIIWNLGAFAEHVNLVTPGGGTKDLVEQYDNLVRQLDLTTINENTSASAYYMEFLNYEYEKAKRIALADNNYALKRFTEILDLVMYTFRLYSDDQTLRLVDHPFAYDMELLQSNSAEVVARYSESLGQWSDIYATGFYKPLQYVIGVLEGADMANWTEKDRIMVLQAIGPVVLNYYFHATQAALRPYSESYFNEIVLTRENKLNEIIDAISNGNEFELEWMEIFQSIKEKMYAQIHLEN